MLSFSTIPSIFKKDPSKKNSSDKIQNEKLHLITSILSLDKYSLKKNHLIFLHKMALKTLEACMEGRYDKFDALTTTRCCHGISFYVYILIQRISILDLNKIHQEGTSFLKIIEESECDQNALWHLQTDLLELTKLYILWFASETNSITKIKKSSSTKLKEIIYLTSDFCRDLVYELQFYFSNLIAHSYFEHVKHVKDNISINQIPLNIWGKYVSPKYLRKDSRGRFYAASLYSVQVVLGCLMYRKSKIALISDLIIDEDEITARYIRIFQGNGENFLPIDEKNLNNNLEPIIVFGGCSSAKTLSKESFFSKMEKWANHFPQLVLAHETSYPQFPNVRSDPDFVSLPIVPTEETLIKNLKYHSKFSGFSLENPSLCCLAHIYPASIKQILSKDLPFSYLPKI